MIIKNNSSDEIIVLYDYIESTGTLYINTGIRNFDNTISFIIDFQYTNITGRQLNGIDNAFYVGINNGKWELSYQNYFGTCDTNRHTFEQKGYVMSNNKVKKEIYFDNSLVGTLDTDSYRATALKDNICIFNIKTLLYSSERIYASRIIVDDVLVRDFVPVTYNGTPGLWDKVELRFYGNNGTGNFILGNRITPNNSLTNRYIGSNEVKKIYIGENLIWLNFPYDAEIEYLESNGTLFIKPKVKTSDGDFIVNIEGCITELPSSNNYTVFFGADSNLQLGVNYDGKAYKGNGSSLFVTYEINTRYLIEGKFSLYENNSYYYVNNTDTGLKRATNINAPNYLFAVGYENESRYHIKAKIYKCTISRNNVIIRDFIPVRIELIGYMYDKISELLFYNSGTGDFILGPDKISGNRYINEECIAYNYGITSKPGNVTKLTKNNTTYNYTSSNSKRTSYYLFNLDATYNKTYNILMFLTGLLSNQNLYIGIQGYNYSHKVDGLNNTQVDHSSDLYDTGWIHLTDTNGVFETNYTVNNNNIVGFRFTFKITQNQLDIDWPSSIKINKIIISEI